MRKNGVDPRRSRWILALTVALTVVLTLPAGATPPSDVQIEVESSFLGGASPFVASGPAVDAGLVCPEGDVFDASAQANGFSSTGFNFQGIKHFVCDDGSGDFIVSLQARIDFQRGTTFYWNVLSGTGDYEDLHGAGSGVGLPCVPDCVLDVYDGGIHHD
jgi:hypothetical protein